MSTRPGQDQSAWRGTPRMIVFDNAPVLTSRAVLDRANRTATRLHDCQAALRTLAD